jgi:ribosomal protein L7/L12
MDDVQLAQRFGIIEAQLRAISQHLGIDCPEFASDGIVPAGASGVPAEVVQLARSGKAIQAISLLRQLTGATLVEAKNVVDSL